MTPFPFLVDKKSVTQALHLRDEIFHDPNRLFGFCGEQTQSIRPGQGDTEAFKSFDSHGSMSPCLGNSLNGSKD